MIRTMFTSTSLPPINRPHCASHKPHQHTTLLAACILDRVKRETIMSYSAQAC
eukprot:m.428801 g.428801  ORF g.428801 m.428801 type:complete len:53 (-) comp16881_c0_seq1:745-903(-)